jgi:hypothetical protein
MPIPAEKGERMKLPYGISNFKSLREEGYLYIDKTRYIEKLEDFGKYLFFIRPRRFGKSLFLSTLAHYYDLLAKEDFPTLFGDLYIGQNPTGLKNGFFILQFNFSGLNTVNRVELEKSFTASLISSITGFFNKYLDVPLFEEKIKNVSDIRSILDLLFEEVKKTGRKIYLIIDEYDHFANDIIAMGNEDFYKEIIRATGFVRDFYETLKIGTESVLDRIFITGISPIMLDDLTSGFNIAINLTMNATVNEMMGFTEQEVGEIIDKAGIIKGKEELLVELKKYYNGYLFNKNCRERLYNPDMLLYFFMQWQISGGYPDQLIDDNVRTDYGRLNRLVSNRENRKTLEEIIGEEGITADIVTKFSFDRMYDPDYFVSLLFYMGLLTIDRQEKTRLLLKIPNYVINTIYWEYIEHRLKEEHHISLDTQDLRKTIEDMAYEGRIEPFIDYISNNVLKALSNRDTMEFDEKYLKVILFSYLVTSGAYKPNSEREVENGYIDIYLEKDIRMPEIKFEWLLELKYLKKSDRHQLERVKEEGLKQLKRYAASRNFQGKQDLKQALLIFIGKDEYVIEES